MLGHLPYEVKFKETNGMLLTIASSLTVYYYHVTCDFQSESTLYNLPEHQGTPWSKQAPYLKFK